MALFYEFFAGGGMARAGLGKGWRCVFANDIDKKKRPAIQQIGEINSYASLRHGEVDHGGPPGRCRPRMASFPCQDLSLAGSGAVLKLSVLARFGRFGN